MMNSEQNSYPYNLGQYSQPDFQKIEYNSFQPEMEQNIHNNYITQDFYQTNNEENNQIEDNNGYNQYFNQNEQNNDINLYYPEDSKNQKNIIPQSNILEEQYNYKPIYESNINNQMNNETNNEKNNYNDIIILIKIIKIISIFYLKK